MGEDIIDMDLNMEGGRKETDEEGKEIAAGTDRSASEQTAPYEAEAAGTEQHIEDDEEIPQLIMEHSGEESGKIRSIQHLDGMYQKWFLDYASYVILERAVPYVNDGLKPVQRRILHSMRELDDGRYNKVANIIGNTMKYHPHGDASIGDALVQLGQKDLLIDCQGNWGNILTRETGLLLPVISRPACLNLPSKWYLIPRQRIGNLRMTDVIVSPSPYL